MNNLSIFNATFKTSCCQVLDSDAQHSPLFVYKLPLGSENVILTDKLILTVLLDSRDKRLMVLSNQKSENLAHTEEVGSIYIQFIFYYKPDWL